MGLLPPTLAFQTVKKNLNGQVRMKLQRRKASFALRVQYLGVIDQFARETPDKSEQMHSLGVVIKMASKHCRLNIRRKNMKTTTRMIMMMIVNTLQHFQIPIRPGNSGEKSHPVDSTEIPLLLLLLLSPG